MTSKPKKEASKGWSSLSLDSLKRVEKVLAAILEDADHHDKPVEGEASVAQLNFNNGRRSILTDVRRAIGVHNQRKERDERD